jgi:hypothetical protein
MRKSQEAPLFVRVVFIQPVPPGELDTPIIKQDFRPPGMVPAKPKRPLGISSSSSKHSRYFLKLIFVIYGSLAAKTISKHSFIF